MEIDVRRLQEMHPRLAPTTVADYLFKVGVGLARHNHISPVPLELTLDDTERNASLAWQEDGAGVDNLDFNRVTEDAAEAIALAVVSAAHGWTVRRRAQREESADWLLHDAVQQPIALEISGVDMVDRYSQRLGEKIRQVSRHGNRRAVKVACVVELSPPRCRLKMA